MAPTERTGVIWHNLEIVPLYQETDFTVRMTAEDIFKGYMGKVLDNWL